MSSLSFSVPWWVWPFPSTRGDAAWLGSGLVPIPALLGRAVWNKLQPCRVLSGPLGAALASVVWTRAGAAVRGHPRATSPELWPQRMAVSWGSSSQVPEGHGHVFVSTQVYIVPWKCSSVGFQFVFTSYINCVTSGLKRS